MRAYQITGGVPLDGQITISGAKNAALPIMAATLLSAQESELFSVPDISDVESAIEILMSLGCRIYRDKRSLKIDTYPANQCTILPNLMGKMRAAVIFLGALLARFGEAKIYAPGGCRLGDRPIDLHLLGLRHMGYRCEYDGDELSCYAENLRGCTVALPFPSVGATENILLAAMRCKEEITLCNAAREPEITDLIGYLKKCGAQIAGENSSVLHICGGKLHGAKHTIMPDRMEAASYLCAAAATRGALSLKNVCPRHLRAVTDVLRKSGCEVKESEHELFLKSEQLQAVSPIRTMPYSGFPTDAQAPMMAAMATADGVSVFEETIFSDRYRHVPALRKMGAKVHAMQRCAVVEGVKNLHGATVEATDLRGGAAMVIAALSAEGESQIKNIAHIERGYASLTEKLGACGAQISMME